MSFLTRKKKQEVSIQEAEKGILSHLSIKNALHHQLIAGLMLNILYVLV